MIEVFMKMAMQEAQEAARQREVPVGAVIVSSKGEILGRGRNNLMGSCDPTAHAEIVALRAACEAVGQHRLDGASLYVTLEPCAMCGHALGLARLKKLYFGAFDPKGGGILHGARVLESSLHKVDVMGGILETECRQILQGFFQRLRQEKL